MLQYQLTRQGTIMTHTQWGWLTAFWLDLRPAWKGIHAWDPRQRKVIHLLNIYVHIHGLLLLSILVREKYFYVCGYLAHIYVCAPYTCSAHRDQTRSWAPWNWSYRLWATPWVLETESAVSALNCWAVLWAPKKSFHSEWQVIKKQNTSPKSSKCSKSWE
jgi:hypothetical protein